MGGFNAYPALNIRQPDLGRILGRVADLKTSGLRNQLLQQKMDRDAELATLRGKMLSGGPPGAQVTNALAAGGGPTPQAAAILTRGTGAAGAGPPAINSPMMRKYLALDPEGGSQMINAIAKMGDQDRKRLAEQNTMTARLLMSVEDAPPEKREAAYAQALAQAERMGLPVSGAPPQYDPQWAQRQIMLAMGIDDILGERERRSKAPTLQDYFGPQGGERRGYMKDGQMVQVGGTKAPKPDARTGPMQDALAMGLKKGDKNYNDYIAARTLRKGMQIEFDAEGRVSSISTGGPAGKSGLTPATTTDIQKKLVGINEGYARLQEIAATFKPEYQEIGTRWDALLTSWKAKLSGAGSVDPEDRKLLTEFSDFKRTSVSGFNLYVKSITGAQVSEHEASRLQQGFPNPGTGLIDGDDPITFKSKLDSTMRELALAKARHQHYLTKGITDVDEMAKKTPLDSMEVFVNPQTDERIVQIDNEWVPL